MYRIALRFKLTPVNRVTSGRKETERPISAVVLIRLFIPRAERDGCSFDISLVVVFTKSAIKKYIGIDFRCACRCRSDNRTVLSFVGFIFY